jgi:hypothetical protein
MISFSHAGKEGGMDDNLSAHFLFIGKIAAVMQSNLFLFCDIDSPRISGNYRRNP